MNIEKAIEQLKAKELKRVERTKSLLSEIVHYPDIHSICAKMIKQEFHIDKVNKSVVVKLDENKKFIDVPSDMIASIDFIFFDGLREYKTDLFIGYDRYKTRFLCFHKKGSKQVFSVIEEICNDLNIPIVREHSYELRLIKDKEPPPQPTQEIL
jgi:hypothetical protein